MNENQNIIKNEISILFNSNISIFYSILFIGPPYLLSSSSLYSFIQLSLLLNDETEPLPDPPSKRIFGNLDPDFVEE